MTNSGIKRGLAVAATSALALVGLPFLAGTATAAQSVGGQLANDIVLYTPLPAGASTKNDGADTKVSVVAGVSTTIGGTTVNSVRLKIDDVAVDEKAPTNGVARFLLDLPNAASTKFEVEALDNFGNVLDTAVNNAVVSSGREAVHFDNADFSSVGQYNGFAVVRGTSSTNTVQVHSLGPVAPGPIVNAAVGAPNAGIYNWVAPVNVSNELTTPGEDVSVLRASANAQSNDVAVVKVYDQAITNVTAELAPGSSLNVPFGNGVADDTDWVIKVTDQNGKPIYGAEVREADASGAYTPGGNGTPNVVNTDVDGNATVTLNEGTMDNGSDRDPAANSQKTYYRVEVNGIPGYQSGVDWLLEIQQTNYAATAKTVTIDNKLANVNSDGTAMDDDENSTLTFTVKDQNGNPAVGEVVRYKVDRGAGHGAAATYVNSAPTNAQGKVSVPLPADDPLHTTGDELHDIKIDAYVNVDGNPNPSGGDAIADTFNIKVGESEVVWDNGTRHQVLANGSTTESGTLKLRGSNVVLPGRTVAMDGYTGNGAPGNSGIAPTVDQPATPGVVTGDSDASDGHTEAEAKTGPDGKLSIKLVDPAAPVGQETDAELEPANINGPNGLFVENRITLTVDWLRSLTPATVVMRNANNDNADSLAGGFGGNDDLQPGKLGVGYVEARNADGVLLSDATIPVKITEGNFVDVSNPIDSLFDPAPVVGNNLGEWSNIGKTINYVTGDDFQGASDSPASFGDDDVIFAVNIERNQGFDDDGLVDDKVIAGTGTASFEHDFKWNTIQAIGGLPLNNGSFSVALSANQESPVLPKARAGAYGHGVTYDVVTTDQFGNRTQQSFSVLDNTPVAHSTNAGVSQFTLDAPAITAWADSATNQSLEVELVNQTKSKIKDIPTNSTLSILASIASMELVTPDDIQTTTAPINWYNLDLANSTFTLGQAGAETIPVGSTVNEIAKAVDQEGAPIAGIGVTFTRSGPSDEDSDGNVFGTTGAAGNAVYTFAGGKAGTATTTASFFDGNNLIAQVEDKVEFKGGTGGGQVAINAKIEAKNNGAKKDKLKVNAGDVKAKGATVKLYRTTPSGDVLIGTKTLNKNGKRSFKVVDRNGKKVTRYYAVVSATDLTKGDRTPVKKVK
ncbi:hypothetical protein [Nocardioides daejeonensis]|uniref:hypothetical protein n=1 Tax=Nocardioides daejeonensis TaxID=1046556 RepID=UPI0013A57363|nr:hypothetical protein [Nocardioides daejeonensis]